MHMLQMLEKDVRLRDAAIALQPSAKDLLNEASALLHWIKPPKHVVDGRLNYGYAIQELLRTMFGSSDQEDGSDYNKVAFWQVNAVLRDCRLDPCLAYHPDKCFRHGIYLEVCVPLVYTLIVEKWDRFRSPMVHFCTLGDLLMFINRCYFRKTVHSLQRLCTVFLSHLSIARPQ
ncbi:hypothetical protein JTE90_021404 [Oedothorax gibbosus]|uniref:Uncharacterized protein n=1 Tax=Oedothorax gibbosus TaxID=931172 RepID=A0AAV6VH12_9ARAC|nr:hypothetical protein JTE90_021404 [Oedothorax gibbosus]